MTDAEIVRAVAEKVMGWVHGRNHFVGRIDSWFDGNVWIAWAYLEPDGADDDVAFYNNRSAWNPLTSDADACMVLRRLSHLHPRVSYDDTLCGWMAEFIGVIHETSAFVEGIEGFGRAISIAALKAVGAYNE